MERMQENRSEIKNKIDCITRIKLEKIINEKK